MATVRDQIEHRPWMDRRKSKKWLKRQMNRYMRRTRYDEESVGRKTNRKPTKGWDY